jgi:hypothetical protein
MLRSIQKSKSKGANALTILAPALDGAGLSQAIAIAEGYADKATKGWILSTLVARLPAAEREPKIPGLLAVAKTARDWPAGSILHNLAPILKGKQLDVAVRIWSAMGDVTQKLYAFAALAPRLSRRTKSRVVAKALPLAKIIAHGKQLIGNVANPLSPALSKGVLDAAMQIEDDYDKCGVLATLLKVLPEDICPIALHEILRLMSPTRYPGIVSATSREIAAALPTKRSATIFNKILAAAAKLGANNEAVILARLAPAPPDKERMKVVAKALRQAQRFEWLPGSLSVIGSLIPYLPSAERSSILRKARDAVTERKNSGEQDLLLSLLIRLLPDDLQSETLDMFIDSANPVSRPRLLSILPHFLPVVARLEGLEGLMQIRRAIEDSGRWFP